MLVNDIDKNLTLRTLLNEEYQRRALKNPSFSLRAFAQKLNIDVSLLSKLLRGKRQFTRETTLKVTDFLGVTESAIFDHLNFTANDYTFLEEDHFLILSHYIHFALLEYFKLNEDFDIKIIAKRFRTTPVIIEGALNRLVRLKFIKSTKDGYKLMRPENEWVDFKRTSSARKKYQIELLEKAIERIEDIDVVKRDNTSNTMAIDPELMPEVKKKITQFRRSLDKYVDQNSKRKTEVYNLSVAFFPLTKNLKNL
ncbi:MAG: TIGR02147 family protein [Bdellovibrionota bacterium]